MTHSAKRQTHEQARKQHRHDQEQRARALAKKPRAAFPRVLLVAGVVLMLVAVLGVAVLG